MARIARILLIVALLGRLCAGGVSARRAVGTGTKVWITEGRYTLAELASAVADPSLVKYEEGVATIYGAFELSGKTAELVIGPGETLRMRHVPVPPGQRPPPQQVIDRRIFLTEGRVAWKDCTVEGFYWINVDPSVAGVWENVTFRVADDHNDQYEPIEFGSSHLRWRGGEADARRCTKTLLPTSPWTKLDVKTTIEGVRFLSGGMILGPRPVVTASCEYTFRNCVFDSPLLGGRETPRMFTIESHASDLGAVRVKLINPAFAQGQSADGRNIARVTGATAKLVSVHDEKETEYVDESPDLHATEGSDSFERLSQDAAALRAAFNGPAFAKDLGSLFWPCERLGTIACGVALARSAKRCSDRDMQRWMEWNSEAKQILDGLPDLWRPGSRYCPTPVPFPLGDPALSHTAAARRRPDGTVDLRTSDSHLIYDPHGNEDKFASFTAESRIRGRSLMDVFPPYGAISIRRTGRNKTPSLDGHYDWKTRITKPDGKGLAAMEAWTPGGASATIVCFRDLPDVILFDVDSNHVRYQAYAKGAGRRYNGQRLWNNDPAGIKRRFHREKLIPISDPERGVFVASLAGEWYETKLARGFIPAAWNGFNDWETSPPCGCMIRAEELDATWTSWSPEGYFSYIVQVDTHHGKGHPNLDDWRETSQVLYVEGKGLGCWENIQALDQAWNRPLELQPVVLEPEKECPVVLHDAANLERPVEIILLPKWCGDMRSEHDVYRGAHTILLLRRTAPGAKVTVGTLPLKLANTAKNEWRIVHGGKTPIPDVHVRLPGPEEREVAMMVGGANTEFSRGQDGVLETVVAISPGETVVRYGIAKSTQRKSKGC